MDLKEHEWIKHLKKLEELFRQSYPTGTSKEFVQWVYSNYGYTYED